MWQCSVQCVLHNAWCTMMQPRRYHGLTIRCCRTDCSSWRIVVQDEMVPEIEDLLAWLSALPSNPTVQLKREGSSAARCAAAVTSVDHIT